MKEMAFLSSPVFETRKPKPSHILRTSSLDEQVRYTDNQQWKLAPGIEVEKPEHPRETQELRQASMLRPAPTTTLGTSYHMTLNINIENSACCPPHLSFKSTVCIHEFTTPDLGESVLIIPYTVRKEKRMA